jgi:hypothetical protein
MDFRGQSEWLTAIERILLDAAHPLDAAAIARSAIKQRLVRSAGLSPAESVRVAIHRHIQEDYNDLGIVVTGSLSARRYTLVDDPKIRALFRRARPVRNPEPISAVA